MSPLELAGKAAHEALSRANISAYLDMPSDTASIVARAVIEAIREPSGQMQRAAFNQKVSFRSTSGMSDIGQVSVEYASEPDKGAATLWTSMIDALLAEGGE